MPACFLVHGYNDPSFGATNIDRLAPMIQKRGWAIEQFDYETHWYTWHWLAIDRLAQRLAGRVRTGDMAIGFSTGACIIFLAMKKYSAQFRRVILVSPNLDRDARFPRPGLEHVFVWHSPSDTVVKSAASLPFHPFGDMGAAGYVGDDPRVKNYNKEEDFSVKSTEHAAVLEDAKQFAFFAPLIVEDVPNLTAAVADLLSG